MRLIFLDIDGVLNSDLWYQSETARKRTGVEKHFDPRCVDLLNRVARKTKAHFVISSTWRNKYSHESLKKILSQIGLRIHIIGFTPNLKTTGNYVLRGNEILKWCMDHEELLDSQWQNYANYAILDDKTDFLLWQQGSFFRTDRYTGLTPSLCQRVVKHFSTIAT